MGTYNYSLYDIFKDDELAREMLFKDMKLNFETKEQRDEFEEAFINEYLFSEIGIPLDVYDTVQNGEEVRIVNINEFKLRTKMKINNVIREHIKKLTYLEQLNPLEMLVTFEEEFKGNSQDVEKMIAKAFKENKADSIENFKKTSENIRKGLDRISKESILNDNTTDRLDTNKDKIYGRENKVNEGLESSGKLTKDGFSSSDKENTWENKDNYTGYSKGVDDIEYGKKVITSTNSLENDVVTGEDDNTRTDNLSSKTTGKDTNTTKSNSSDKGTNNTDSTLGVQSNRNNKYDMPFGDGSANSNTITGVETDAIGNRKDTERTNTTGSNSSSGTSTTNVDNTVKDTGTQTNKQKSKSIKNNLFQNTDNVSESGKDKNTDERNENKQTNKEGTENSNTINTNRDTSVNIDSSNKEVTSVESVKDKDIELSQRKTDKYVKNTNNDSLNKEDTTNVKESVDKTDNKTSKEDTSENKDSTLNKTNSHLRTIKGSLNKTQTQLVTEYLNIYESIIMVMVYECYDLFMLIM